MAMAVVFDPRESLYPELARFMMELAWFRVAICGAEPARGCAGRYNPLAHGTGVRGMHRRINRLGFVLGPVPGGQAGVTLAAILTLAACSGAPPRAAGRAPVVKPPPPVTLTGHGTVSATLPGCATATQPAPELPRSLVTLTTLPSIPYRIAVPGRRVTVRLRSMPFGVAVMPDDQWGFVTMGASVGVVRLGAAGPARLVRQVGTAQTRHGSPDLGAVLTPDGRYLLAVKPLLGGFTVISTAAAERGGKDAVLGQVSAPGGRLEGAIEVAVTPDGRYAFVSEEDADQVAVFNLRRALAGHYGAASYVGAIPAQLAPVGLAVSPDGKWLYSTSEVISSRGQSEVGSLAVISVARAEADPARSVIARVPAGCNPVRVITSDDGRVVWVTARASDALLAFSASALAAGSPHPLLASIRVGELPVGIGLARDGQLLVVADSDRFDVPGEHASLAVVDVADMLAGRPALLGYLPSGQFPRDIASGPGGQLLLVANFASGQLETVRLDSLP
jgi:DNA-binding beta-propeller fold protein YncE